METLQEIVTGVKQLVAIVGVFIAVGFAIYKFRSYKINWDRLRFWEK